MRTPRFFKPYHGGTVALFSNTGDYDGSFSRKRQRSH
jgi:hypothetical protein